ncbi:unnamed protein product [Heligmosomoides polygyrus]|uniref:Secreted protein n=1 Tax=Heligmosomoides polygyrus TaxID=6339 RepID=A0A183FQN6_HELPZ|nr:unnamed protein product [Heligmosomoides polygyrus]
MALSGAFFPLATNCLQQREKNPPRDRRPTNWCSAADECECNRPQMGMGPGYASGRTNEDNSFLADSIIPGQKRTTEELQTWEL